MTLSALDYFFKDYLKPWVVAFLTFVAKQCWPKLCLLAGAGTFAWQHYLIVYSGDTGEGFQLQKTIRQRWQGLRRRVCYQRLHINFSSLSLNASPPGIKMESLRRRRRPTGLWINSTFLRRGLGNLLREKDQLKSWKTRGNLTGLRAESVF